MTSPESQLAQILGEWQERIDRGEEVDAEAVIQAHPDLADQLRRQFKALSKVGRARKTGERDLSLRTLPTARYRDFKPAGEGGMGIVYWAIDTDLNREVAFKIVRPQGSENSATPMRPTDLATPEADTPASQSFQTLKQRFLQEAWITSGMSHPGIIPVYELGQTPDGVPYYTMRFIKGETTLATAMEAAAGKDLEERLTLLEPFLKICDTLRYSHSRGVIHRDLKPANIALGEFGEVVVLDWGLAKTTGSEEATGDLLLEHIEEYREATDLKTVAGAMGTPGYMAPEAALGELESMDERSDVYSLGAMLFELLTGRMPYRFTTFAELGVQLMREDAPNAREIDGSVPEGLAELCARCLSRDMHARPRDAEEVARAIRTWQVEREREREVEGFLREASTALDAADELHGADMLRQLDRATAAVSQVLKRRPESTRALEYQAKAESLRETGIRERERTARRRTLVRGGVAGLLVLLVGAAASVALVDSARRDEAAQRLRAQEAEVVAGDALRRARALLLVNASEEVQTTDPMRALILAREAARLSTRPEVVSQLNRTLHEDLPSVEIRGHETDVRGVRWSPDGKHILTTGYPEKEFRVWDALGREVARFRGHEGPVSSVRFTGTGNRIVSAGADNTVRVWDLDGHQLSVIRATDEPLTWAIPSSDGERILTGSRTGPLRLRNEAGETLAVYPNHQLTRQVPLEEAHGLFLTLGRGDEAGVHVWDRDGNRVGEVLGSDVQIRGAQLSPNGALVLAQMADRTSRLWSTRGAPSPDLAQSETVGQRIQFSPTGDRLLAVDRKEGTARLLDLTGSTLVSFGDDTGHVRHALFSPTGRHVVTLDVDGAVHVYDIEGRKRATLRVRASPIEKVHFSPDGDRVLTTSVHPDTTARVWDLDGRQRAVLRHDHFLLMHAFSPDGTRLITVAYQDSVARIWDLDTTGPVLRGHIGKIHVLAPIGRGRVVAVDDSALRVWSLHGGELVVVPHEDDRPGRVDVSPTGHRFVTTYTNGAVRLWDRDGNELALLSSPLGEKAGASAVVFSPQGDRILIRGQAAATARLYADDGKLLATIPAQSTRQVGMRFLPTGGGFLLTTTDGKPVTRVYDSQGQQTAALDGLISAGFSYHDYYDSISPTGAYVLTASPDNLVRLWDVAGNELAALPQQGTPYFSATGDHFLTFSTEDKRARLWDLEGRELAAFDGFSRFSPTGDRVVVGGFPSKVRRVFDLQGQELASMVGHTGGISHAWVSPDGERMVTGSSMDGTSRLWRMDGSLLALLGSDVGRVTADFSTDGRYVLATNATDQAALLWDRDGNHLLTMAEVRDALALAVKDSNDEDFVLTADLAGNLRLWFTDNSSLVLYADDRITRPLTAAERERYAELLGEPGDR